MQGSLVSWNSTLPSREKKSCSWRFLSNSNEHPPSKSGWLKQWLLSLMWTGVLFWESSNSHAILQQPGIFKEGACGEGESQNPRHKQWELAPQLAVLPRAGPARLGDPTMVRQLLVALSHSNLVVLQYTVVFCLAWLARHRKRYLEKAKLFQSSRCWMALLPRHPAPPATALLGVRVRSLLHLNTVLVLGLCLCTSKGWTSGISSNTSPSWNNQKNHCVDR